MVCVVRSTQPLIHQLMHPCAVQFGGVHGNQKGTSKMWRNKPLLRREGDKIFKTGQEAVQLLNSEAVRKDAVLTQHYASRMDLPNFTDQLIGSAYTLLCLPWKGEVEFLDCWRSMTSSLSVVFERMPKYAWIMKQVCSVHCYCRESR